jgi:tetratricopeptide (TPR) repeat protein
MRHLQVAESGRQAALRGDHLSALRHYREAMVMAVTAGDPEVFFRHYLEATLESLELMKAFDDVLAYCERALQHYSDHPPQHELAQLDLAAIHQRRGVVLLKTGQTDQARAALVCAVEVADRIGASLDLGRLLLRWLSRGLVVSPERVLKEQQRLGYFSMRAQPPDSRAPLD